MEEKKEETILTPKILLETDKSRLWCVENYTEDFYEQIKDIELEEEPPIIVMGRDCRMRRDVGFFSDISEGYFYSGQIARSLRLSSNSVLPWILPEVNKSLGSSFNGILINRYMNGEKYLSAHSDDESGLDKGGRKMVASICYGPGLRTFRVRDKQTKKIILDYSHTPCTLLVMEGEFQREFTHEIPIQKKIKEPRISLSFRHHTY